MQDLVTIQDLIAGAAVAIATWFAMNFLGEPVVALQRQRIETLQIAERYSAVDASESEALRDVAANALLEAGTALRAYQRAWSTAVRLWCWMWGYDLDLAAQILFGLADGPRGKIVISPDARMHTLNALHVALGAHRHMSPETVAAVKRMIAQTKAAGREKPPAADGAAT
jgi:hypothetical protein